jgi:hypothetical protein
VNALQQLGASSAGGQAVKAVFLVGDPFHLAGKKSNEDQSGGKTTANLSGIESADADGGIPAAWDGSGKVLDVCYQVRSVESWVGRPLTACGQGDGVCSGDEITIQYTYYSSSASVQTLGSNLLIKQLQ